MKQMDTNNTIDMKDLRTNDVLQDKLINDLRIIEENGMGGFSDFLTPYIPNLLLGIYATDKQVAPVLGLKNMKNYGREIDSKGNKNYKYKRITDYNSEKVTSDEFENWITEKWNNLQNIEISTNENSEFQELTVQVLKKSTSSTIFNVNGIEVEVGHQGTWFYPCESIIIAAQISEKPEDEFNE